MLTDQDPDSTPRPRSGARATPKFRVGALSHQGNVRRENQDRITRFCCPLGEVFVVVDGMGGHQGGSRAAEMVARTVQRRMEEIDAAADPAEALRTAARLAHEEVHRQALAGDPEESQMGATAVLLLVREGQAWIGHAGDSRAYLLRDGRLGRLTRDHTRVQRMLDGGLLTEEQARTHPDASVVTRAFGRESDFELEVAAPVEIREGDRWMLCSDGLGGYVDDALLHDVLASSAGAQASAERLVDLALAAGGEDNVSVQVLSFRSQPAPAASPAPTSAAMPPSPRAASRGSSARATRPMSVPDAPTAPRRASARPAPRRRSRWKVLIALLLIGLPLALLLVLLGYWIGSKMQGPATRESVKAGSVERKGPAPAEEAGSGFEWSDFLREERQPVLVQPWPEEGPDAANEENGRSNSQDDPDAAGEAQAVDPGQAGDLSGTQVEHVYEVNVGGRLVASLRVRTPGVPDPPQGTILEPGTVYFWPGLEGPAQEVAEALDLDTREIDDHRRFYSRYPMLIIGVSQLDNASWQGTMRPYAQVPVGSARADLGKQMKRLEEELNEEKKWALLQSAEDLPHAPESCLIVIPEPSSPQEGN